MLRVNSGSTSSLLSSGMFNLHLEARTDALNDIYRQTTKSHSVIIYELLNDMIKGVSTKSVLGNMECLEKRLVDLKQEEY